MKFDVVFCCRAYNDLDHMVPVIHRLSKDKPNYSIKLVICNSKEDFRKDYRISYVLARGVTVEHILEYCGFGKKSITEHCDQIREIYATGFNRWNIKRAWLSNAVVKPRLKKIKERLKRLCADHFIDVAFGSSNSGVMVFDHSADSFYKDLCKCAHKLGIGTLAIPHGMGIIENDLSVISMLDIENHLKDVQRYPFQHVVYSDKYEAERAIRRGYVLKEQIKVFGATRFCDEWLSVISEIVPEVKLPDAESYKLRVVFMMSKPQYNIFQDEVERLICFISKFPDTVLVLKPHTRGMVYEGKIPENVYVVDNNTPSTRLIDWADLTIFSTTGIIFENLKKNRPVLFLKNIIANKMVFGKFIKCWDIECRDDLRDHLWAFLKDKNRATYTPNERDVCLKELVEPAGKDVLGFHVQLIIDSMSEKTNSVEQVLSKR